MKSSSYLFINNIRLHYIHWNMKDSGLPVVMVHGLAYSARSWDYVAPLLAEKGWKTMALDLRGHGLSDKPEGDYSFDVIVSDLAAFLDMANVEKPLLIGHSWGGMVVLDYARRISIGPGSPAGIVLVDGGIGQLSDIPGATWEKVRDFLSPSNTEGLSTDQLKKRLLRPNSTWTLTKNMLPSMLANYQIDENGITTPRLSYGRHIQILQKIWEFNSCDYYPHIRCPVLMIPTRPKEPLDGFAKLRFEFRQRGIEQAKSMISDLSVHWMVDTIHDVPLQRPRELADLIDQFGKNNIR